jgi:hypothetical protein
LVFFGATGISPTRRSFLLQAMIRCGHQRTGDRRQSGGISTSCRAPATVRQARRRRPAAFKKLIELSRRADGDYDDDATFTVRAKAGSPPGWRANGDSAQHARPWWRRSGRWLREAHA